MEAALARLAPFQTRLVQFQHFQHGPSHC
jgi:hypothetical protein